MVLTIRIEWNMIVDSISGFQNMEDQREKFNFRISKTWKDQREKFKWGSQ